MSFRLRRIKGLCKLVVGQPDDLAEESLCDKLLQRGVLTIDTPVPTIYPHNRITYYLVVQMKTRKLYFYILSLAAAGLVSLSSDPSFATNNCIFVTKGKTMSLRNDCTTDATIYVPNGFALLGSGYSITAVDPVGGNFQGAVVRNSGRAVTINYVKIRSNVQDVCNSVEQGIVGIGLDNVNANMLGVDVTINKGNTGMSTCEEGIAVDVTNSAPAGSKPPKTYIKNSTFNNNQWIGVRTSGFTMLRLQNSIITGAGPNPYVSQRGVDLRSGAKGQLIQNTINNHTHQPLMGVPAVGVLLTNAAVGTLVDRNMISTNDIGVHIDGGTGVNVTNARVTSSLQDGILLDDQSGIVTTACSVLTNESSKNKLSGIRVRSINGLVTKNVVKSNLVTRNKKYGIFIDAAAQNKVQKNTADGTNTLFDLFNSGVGNLYSGNTCLTSNGSPIDCPPHP